MTWVWMDGRTAWTGGAPTLYVSWEPGQPNDASGGQDCATYREDMGGMWVDRDCTLGTRFICESL